MIEENQYNSVRVYKSPVDSEFHIFEFQGTFRFEDCEGIGQLADEEFGLVSEGEDKYILTIRNTVRLEGSRHNLAKPLYLCEKMKSDVHIVAEVKSKIIFKQRPNFVFKDTLKRINQ